MRKFIFILIAILLSSGVLGFFYFDHKFTPPVNQLRVSDHQDILDIKWLSNEDSEFSALLLPINFEGIPDTFYLQFDLGAHSTLFYKKAVQSIREKYPDFNLKAGENTDRFSFGLGNILVSITEVKMLDYGQEVSWKDSSINIIGTLGADILEHKVTVMDFRKHRVHFSRSFPKEVPPELIQTFEFEKRKVMLSGQVKGKDTQFYYDSGSSGFELITDKSQWEELALSGAVERSYQANSWGKTLGIHTIASDVVIRIGKKEIQLNEVTYIEGTSFIQNLLMYFSGMGGMIGNKLFIGQVLVLDAQDQKFAVLRE